jgi:hypothetical protein
MLRFEGKSTSYCDGIRRRSFLQAGFLGLGSRSPATGSSCRSPGYRQEPSENFGHLHRAGGWPHPIRNLRSEAKRDG